MKLKYIKSALIDKEFKIELTVNHMYSTELRISDYTTVIAYHNKDKEVFELQLLAVAGIDNVVYNQDVIKLVDLCTNLLTELTSDLRDTLYKKIELGLLNIVELDLENFKVSYKLTDNGLLEYRIIDTRENFLQIPPLKI